MEKAHPMYTTYRADKEGNIYNKNNKKMQSHDNGNGYLYVCLRHNGNNHTLRASRFVFECFNGPIEKNKIIDHIDNNKLNNKIGNLQMITQSKNVKKYFETHEKKYKPAKKVNAIKYGTDEKTAYKSISYCGKILGVVPACVKRVCDKIQNFSLSKNDGTKYSFEYTI
jgi:hypothetical protein